MGKEAGANAPTIEEMENMATALMALHGKIDEKLNEVDDRFKALTRLVTDSSSEIKQSLGRIEQFKGRLDRFDEKQDAFVERLDRPVTAVFKPDATFYSTMGTRLGEEVRAALDSRMGTLSQQLAMGMEAAVKANMPKPAWGSAITPVASVVAAAGILVKLYWDYAAQQAYVPADVRVSVNGTAVPHSVQQSHGAPHAVNGAPRSFARS